MIEALGANGQLTFDGQLITIHRGGGMGGGMRFGKGEKQIPISNVQAVLWTPPNGIVNGFIHFTIAGATDPRRKQDLHKDENTVMFKRSQARSFEAFRDAIQSAIAAGRHPQQFPSVQAQAPSKLDQLKQLGELRESGVLTPEEFEAEKARIMSGGELPYQGSGDIGPPSQGAGQLAEPKSGQFAQKFNQLGQTVTVCSLCGETVPEKRKALARHVCPAKA